MVLPFASTPAKSPVELNAVFELLVEIGDRGDRRRRLTDHADLGREAERLGVARRDLGGPGRGVDRERRIGRDAALGGDRDHIGRVVDRDGLDSAVHRLRERVRELVHVRRQLLEDHRRRVQPEGNDVAAAEREVERRVRGRGRLHEVAGRAPVLAAADEVGRGRRRVEEREFAEVERRALEVEPSAPVSFGHGAVCGHHRVRGHRAVCGHRAVRGDQVGDSGDAHRGGGAREDAHGAVGRCLVGCVGQVREDDPRGAAYGKLVRERALVGDHAFGVGAEAELVEAVGLVVERVHVTEVELVGLRDDVVVLDALAREVAVLVVRDRRDDHRHRVAGQVRQEDDPHVEGVVVGVRRRIGQAVGDLQIRADHLDEVGLAGRGRIDAEAEDLLWPSGHRRQTAGDHRGGLHLGGSCGNGEALVGGDRRRVLLDGSSVCNLADRRGGRTGGAERLAEVGHLDALDPDRTRRAGRFERAVPRGSGGGVDLARIRRVRVGLGEHARNRDLAEIGDRRRRTVVDDGVLDEAENGLGERAEGRDVERLGRDREREGVDRPDRHTVSVCVEVHLHGLACRARRESDACHVGLGRGDPVGLRRAVVADVDVGVVAVRELPEPGLGPRGGRVRESGRIDRKGVELDDAERVPGTADRHRIVLRNEHEVLALAHLDRPDDPEEERARRERGGARIRRCGVDRRARQEGVRRAYLADLSGVEVEVGEDEQRRVGDRESRRARS